MKVRITFLLITFLLYGCATNPFTGKKTLAFVSDDDLFPMAFAQYAEVLDENKVVTGTSDAEMSTRVGQRIARADGPEAEAPRPIKRHDPGLTFQKRLAQGQAVVLGIMIDQAISVENRSAPLIKIKDNQPGIFARDHRVSALKVSINAPDRP